MTDLRRWRKNEHGEEQGSAVINYRAEVESKGIPVAEMTDEQCIAIYNTLNDFHAKGAQTKVASPQPSVTQSVVERDTFTHCRFCKKVVKSTEQYSITHPTGHEISPDPIHIWLNSCRMCEDTLARVSRDSLIAAAVSSPAGRKILTDSLRAHKSPTSRQPELPFPLSPSHTARQILASTLPQDAALDAVNGISHEIHINDYLAGSDIDCQRAIPDNKTLAEWAHRNGWKESNFGNYHITLAGQRYRLHIKKRVIRLDREVASSWQTILSATRMKVFLTPTQIGGLTRHTGVIRAINGGQDIHDRAADYAIDKGEHTKGVVPGKFNMHTRDDFNKVK